MGGILINVWKVIENDFFLWRINFEIIIFIKYWEIKNI